MKIKKIRIKSVEEGLKDFARNYRAVSEGKTIKKQTGTYFASIEAVRKVLTEERIRLLKTIKQEKPRSIYELARITGRNFKNVSQDISFLENLGLVDLRKPSGARNQRKPVLLSDRFSVEFSI